MKVCGIMAAKEHSKRFPGKNRLMYKHNLSILCDAVGRENVFMFTDDMEIMGYCIKKAGVWVIQKGINFDDEYNHLDILRYCIMNLNNKYDIIVSILCNTVGHTSEKIREAVRALQDHPEAIEVKSFDHDGCQSGIFAFWADRLPEKRHRIAMIISNGKEIHYKEELEAWNE